MKQDKLIELAKAAGFYSDERYVWTESKIAVVYITEKLTKFADLVSANAITSMQTEQPVAYFVGNSDGTVATEYAPSFFDDAFNEVGLTVNQKVVGLFAEQGHSAANEVLGLLKETREMLFKVSGSALLAGEKCKKHDGSILYKLVIEANTNLDYCQTLLEASPAPITSMQGDSEPVSGYLVTWEESGETFVQAHASWLPADSQARHKNGKCEPLYLHVDRVKGVSDANHVHLVKQIDAVIAKLGLTQEQAWTEGGSLHAPRICNHIQETLDALAEANNKVAKLLGSCQLSTNTDGWQPTQVEVAAWNERNSDRFQGNYNESLCAIHDARSMHLLSQDKGESV